MKKGNLAASASKKVQDVAAEKRAQQKKLQQTKTFDNYEIAIHISKTRKRNEEAFPSKDIETLMEMAIKVVAANF